MAGRRGVAHLVDDAGKLHGPAQHHVHHQPALVVAEVDGVDAGKAASGARGAVTGHHPAGGQLPPVGDLRAEPQVDAVEAVHAVTQGGVQLGLDEHVVLVPAQDGVAGEALVIEERVAGGVGEQHAATGFDERRHLPPQPDVLEDAHDLGIEVAGPRQGVRLGGTLVDAGSDAGLAQQVRQRGADGSEADDRDLGGVPRVGWCHGPLTSTRYGSGFRPSSE